MSGLHHPAVRLHLVWSKDHENFPQRRVHCRSHVRLYDVPGRIDSSLTTSKDRRDRRLLRGVQIQPFRQMRQQVANAAGGM